MNSIPFHLPDVGLREIRGRVYVEEEFLVIEVEDALMGEFDRDRQTIKVEPGALREIRLDLGLLRDRLCLRPKRGDLLAAMPGDHAHELQLRIWRTHRRRAQQLVEELRRLSTAA